MSTNGHSTGMPKNTSQTKLANGLEDAYEIRVNDPDWLAAVRMRGTRFMVGLSASRLNPFEITFAQADAEGAAATTELVYAVQMDGSPWAIKLGRTQVKRLRNRMYALASGSPFPLILLKIWPGGPLTEAYLHGLFADERMNGEWFHASERLVDFIGRGKATTRTEWLEWRDDPSIRVTPETSPEELDALLKVIDDKVAND